ncbi:MAG: TolC family protein [Alistipes senegalensis]
MRHNSREYVGLLLLNVPIFNRRAARNDIRTAQIAPLSQRLAVTEAERELRKLIEQAWYNADASYAKYRSAEAAAASARVAFAYEERKAEAAARPCSTPTTPKRAWRRPKPRPCRPNTNSYSVRKYSISTAGNR